VKLARAFIGMFHVNSLLERIQEILLARANISGANKNGAKKAAKGVKKK
jgi:hypothetical protein